MAGREETRIIAETVAVAAAARQVRTVLGVSGTRAALEDVAPAAVGAMAAAAVPEMRGAVAPEETVPLKVIMIQREEQGVREPNGMVRTAPAAAEVVAPGTMYVVRLLQPEALAVNTVPAAAVVVLMHMAVQAAIKMEVRANKA